ncbi:MAG: hypothetical protein E6J21_11485 [Chloroflexota bacterium]|nr:MAG: hypothetical protein E6J21_11485 [Chloroflexota bacterium]
MTSIHRLLTVGCVLVGLMVLVSTISAFFSPSIQAALMIPATPGNRSNTNTALTTQPTMNAPKTGSMPSPTAMTASVLAQDTFQRNNQRLWGTASDGQTWGGNANSSQSFAIDGQTGFVGNVQGVFDAILGPRTTDADVTFSGSLTFFGNGSSNIGSLLRWMDTNNWYKAYLDGTQLILLKKVAGNLTRLNVVVFPTQSNKEYTLRFRVVGSMLMAKAWLTDQAEPSNWMVTANDTSLTAGFGGLRVVVQKGVVARIHMFTEMVAR